MTLTLEVVDGQPPGWDELALGASPSVAATWIALSRQRLPGYRTFCLVDRGRPLVALGGTVVEGPLANGRVDPYRVLSGGAAGDDLLAGAAAPWRDLALGDVLPCGLFMFPQYELCPVGPAAHDGPTLACLVSRIVEWGSACGLRSLAFLYLEPEAPELAAALRRAGCELVELAPRCDLDVTWFDLEGYLAGLSHAHRRSARMDLRDLARRGVAVRARRLLEEEPSLVALRCQIAGRYGQTADLDAERALVRRLHDLFRPEQVTVFEARRGDRLLRFSLFVQEGPDWVAFMTAGDYDDRHSSRTYFATHFYEPVAMAPALGIRRVRYGLGSWEAKRRRGCRLTPLQAAAKVLTA